MPKIKNFTEYITDDEKQFLANGYLVKKCENKDALDFLKNIVVDYVKSEIDFKENVEDIFLDNIHNYIASDAINNLRMGLYAYLNQLDWFKPTYFSFAKNTIERIVCNELAMQNRVNLNIMMPNDGGSNLLPHIDAYSGESPFQCVLWVPLTDCFDTKSVGILNPNDNEKIIKEYYDTLIEGGVKLLQRRVQSNLTWVNVPFGSFLIFCPNLFHGSIENITNETRWSFNVRFKSLLSPYCTQEKGLGSFYLPINIRPATKFGLSYKIPEGMQSND
jgi:sporadic carbohydrate cluster 2OG-Fe(II) oxygenase